MKRRISKRRVKIIIAKERDYVMRLFQFEPKDDMTHYNIIRYMAQVQDYWAAAAYVPKIHMKL